MLARTHTLGSHSHTGPRPSCPSRVDNKAQPSTPTSQPACLSPRQPHKVRLRASLRSRRHCRVSHAYYRIRKTTKADPTPDYCRSQGMRLPSFQVLSDRRGKETHRPIRLYPDTTADSRIGGRTAWSCAVNVAGQNVSARYWYDGQYVNNAREDAAERALQVLGQLPAPPGPQATFRLTQHHAMFDGGAGAVGR